MQERVADSGRCERILTGYTFVDHNMTLLLTQDATQTKSGGSKLGTIGGCDTVLVTWWVSRRGGPSICWGKLGTCLRGKKENKREKEVTRRESANQVTEVLRG